MGVNDLIPSRSHKLTVVPIRHQPIAPRKATKLVKANMATLDSQTRSNYRSLEDKRGENSESLRIVLIHIEKNFIALGSCCILL